MTVRSFEVAAVFAIKDEASRTLKLLSDQVKEFDKLVQGAKERLAALGKIAFPALMAEFEGLNKKLAELPGVTEKAAAGFDTSVGSMLRQTGLLNADWIKITESINAATAAAGRMSATTAAAARAAGIAGPGIVNPRQRIAGVHAPGMHVSSLGIPIPGGHAYMRGGGNLMMGAAAAGAYGLYEEAQLEDQTFQAAWHAGLPRTTENETKLRQILQDAASKTGFNYKQVGEAATDVFRLLKGTPGRGLDVLPELLAAGATEARLKGTSLEQSTKSIIELLHMQQTYDPAEIAKLAPLAGFLSTANPATLQQMTNALSYAMPTLQSGMNMDPADVMFMSTALARAGAKSSKAGTWLRAGFERALPPDPRLVSPAGYERQMLALSELGLVDAAGKSTVLNAAGTGLDINKLLKTVQEHSAALPIEERNAMMKKAFGEQGQRGISLLMQPAVTQQTEALKKEFPDFKTQYGSFLEEYARKSPVQQFRTAFQDLTNILADIGSVALPPVIAGLRSLDDVLKAIHAAWPEKGQPLGLPLPGSIGAAIGPGMAAGAIVGAPIGAALGTPLFPGAGTVVGGLGGAAIGAVAGGAVAGTSWVLDRLIKALEGAELKKYLGNPLVSPAAAAATSRFVPPHFSLGDISDRLGGRALMPGVSPNWLQDFGRHSRSDAMGRLGPASNLMGAASNAISPGGGNTTISVPVKLDLDGRTLADAMSSLMASAFQFPSSPGYFNPQSTFAGGDYSPAA